MSNDHGSIMAVFNAVASYGEISRARLSELTGFSQVTVGKAVEALVSHGVLIEKKHVSGTVGRRSGICKINNCGGIILIDFTASRTRIRICDLSLETHGEMSIDTSDIGEVCMNAFGLFAEIIGGELLGVGCVVPDGECSEYQRAVSEAFGDTQTAVLESRCAWAIANNLHFDTTGMAFFVRASESGVSCAVMQGGELYLGANGRAGVIGKALTDAGKLPECTALLCMAVDPELIHVACVGEAACGTVRAGVLEVLSKFGVQREYETKIQIEPIGVCRDILDGVGTAVRKKYILSKLANNS